MPKSSDQNTRKKIRASKNQTWKRGFRSKGPSKSMKLRANAVILTVVLLSALGLSVNLFRIMVLQHDEYTEMANSRQFNTVKLSATRGSIYDANGAVLAQSATVYKIFVDPGLFRKEMELVEKRNEELREAARKKQENGETAKADVVETSEIRRQVVEYLAETLELDPKKVDSAFDQESNYVELKKQVEKSRADRILSFINEIHVAGSGRTISLASVSRLSDTKRYYPQNELAASVIGFDKADGHGFYGVEKYYDKYLSGVDGRNITAVDANGNAMPYRYSKTYPAIDGDDVYMTLDMTIQTYLENAVNDMAETFSVAKRGCGIMINAKTGAIIAMATSGGFDANNAYEIYDAKKRSEINGIFNEEARTKARNEAYETQWRNKCISETYVPGSVFKVFTASAGLEEDKVRYYGDNFICYGQEIVSGIPIHCSNHSGHGSQDFQDILLHSCNPAFIQIGQRLGKDLFCKYVDAFGLSEKTGIDLPNETNSICKTVDNMSLFDLAHCSYGQTNSLTPIEMVTGYAAVVNGGYLLKPYVVSKVVDQSGNIVKSNEKNVRRQVISEETSEEMRRALQYVVDGNYKSNAYIKGYKIGGKSGTSQKMPTDEYVASYCCFAPADDPEIVLLIMADEPYNGDERYYGATVCAPYCRSVLEKTLPYLGFYPEYTEEEAAHKDITVPMLIDMSVNDAIRELEAEGLKYDISGEGQIVTMQMPITGTTVAKGGTVMLFTESSVRSEMVEVPQIAGTGKTLEQVNEMLAELGLNYVAKGSMDSNSQVSHQNVRAGTMVEKWSIIELSFGTDDDRG